MFSGCMAPYGPAMVRLVQQCGGKVLKAVSSLTTMAVIGADPPPKTIAKLQECAATVSTLNIAAFFKLISAGVLPAVAAGGAGAGGAAVGGAAAAAGSNGGATTIRIIEVKCT